MLTQRPHKSSDATETDNALRLVLDFQAAIMHRAAMPEPSMLRLVLDF